MLLSEMRDLISTGHKAEQDGEPWQDRKQRLQPMTNFSVSDGARNSHGLGSRKFGVKDRDSKKASPTGLSVQDLGWVLRLS